MTKHFDDDDYYASRTPTRTTSVSSSASLSSNQSAFAGKSTGTNTGMGSHQDKARPSYAFEYEGVEYWGSAHSNLDDFPFESGDLLINGYGTLFSPKPFVKSAPSWFRTEQSGSTSLDQILLDWKDFSPPPGSINIGFWQNIVEQARQNGVTRIICCCGAGLGRTGTALASLMLASGYENDPGEAIKNVRSQYNGRAIETKQQELYIWRLVTSEDKIPFQKIFREVHTSSAKALISSTHDFGEDSADAWNRWTLTNNKK